MEMKAYLVDTFGFNDATNRRMLRKVEALPDKGEFIRYFSHLVNSQDKWLARIRQDPRASEMSWWDPVYAFEKLEEEWERSVQAWLDFLNDKTETDLFSEVTFVGYDGSRWAARLVDIALQLNYHSIHHRAQIQVLIRQQGLEPDFIDYIGTRYRKFSETEQVQPS